MFYARDRAVELTGLRKSTIRRTIKCGQISGTKVRLGEPMNYAKCVLFPRKMRTKTKL